MEPTSRNLTHPAVRDSDGVDELVKLTRIDETIRKRLFAESTKLPKILLKFLLGKISKIGDTVIRVF